MYQNKIKMGRLPTRLLKSNEKFLFALPRLINQYGEAGVIDKMSCCQLKCMQEIIHNLSAGNVPVSDDTLEQLQPHALTLNKLRKNNLRSAAKRRLLKQTGHGVPGVLAILAGTVLPYVIEFITRTSRNSG